MSAMGAALANNVWTAAPTAQVSWACPPGVAGSCVRVDVYRNGEFGSTPLPTIFGKLLNISSQGVRATATARVASGNATNCMRPFAVADKWIDNVSPALNPKKFERWQTGGRQCGAAESEGRCMCRRQRQRRHWLHGFRRTSARQVTLKTRQPESDRGQQRRAGLDSYPFGFPTVRRLCFRRQRLQQRHQALHRQSGRIGQYLPTENGVMSGPTNSGRRPIRIR